MSEEWVDWVDEQDQVLHAVPRSQMRREKLRHRATYIVVENSQRQIYVQRRTLSKDYCPGMLDACCGGVVQAGESYDLSALRELAEEMGIRGVSLTPWGSFYTEDEKGKVWGGIYSCCYEGPLRLQVEEVEYVELMTVDQILNRHQEFTADSIVALRHWLERRKAAC